MKLVVCALPCLLIRILTEIPLTSPMNARTNNSYNSFRRLRLWAALQMNHVTSPTGTDFALPIYHVDNYIRVSSIKNRCQNGIVAAALAARERPQISLILLGAVILPRTTIIGKEGLLLCDIGRVSNSRTMQLEL